MADWYGNARSNYFGVKDKEKFKELCNRWDIQPIENQKGQVGFMGNDCNGALPSYLEEDEAGEIVKEFDDFVQELSTNLLKDEVAVMIETGAEKLRYITGYALAVNSKGKTEWLDLNEIYSKAEKLGKNITRAEY
jgi:hypothetical protein